MKPLRRIGRFLSFPHVWTCIIILVIALVSAFISYQLNTLGENYWSSIFANFFAGLITGFVIYLIGCVKQISIIKMQEKKAWLDHLHQMIWEYFNSYHKLISLHFDKFDDNEETFDLIYDVGSLANSINEEILQNTFNETLSFNPVKYCKRNFKYDADALRSEYNILHDNLYMVDFEMPSSKTIIKYFESVDRPLRKLNSEICQAISSLDIRLSAIQKTIL